MIERLHASFVPAAPMPHGRGAGVGRGETVGEGGGVR